MTIKPSEAQLRKGEVRPVTVEILKGCIDIVNYGVTSPALVDTGATVSCINQKYYESLAQHHKVQTSPIKLRIYVADGGVCHVRKAATISFLVAGRSFTHQFVILSGCNRPFILGTDFFKKHWANIDYDKRHLPKVMPTRAIRSTTIPPHEEYTLTCEVTCMEDVEGIQGVTDNMDRRYTVPFLVQRSRVIPVNKNRHPCKILNTSSRPYKIRKGQIIALFTKASDEDFEPYTLRGDEATVNEMVPERKPSRRSKFIPPRDAGREENEEDMDDVELERAAYTRKEALDPGLDYAPNVKAKKVLTKEQEPRLKALLDKYEKAFVGPDGKLGTTPLYEHCIQMKPGVVPCNHQPFRATPEKEQQLNEKCRELEGQDIIEETTDGPWSSRSFCVHKASGGVRLVTDFRYVNANIINQALISPNMDVCLESVGEMRPTVFSK